MPENRVEVRPAVLLARHQVEIPVISVQICEALVPALFFDPPGLAPLDLGDRLRGLIRIRLGRRQRGTHRAHPLGDQFFAQPVALRRPALLFDPTEESLAVPVGTMAMQAFIRAASGEIAALDVIV